MSDRTLVRERLEQIKEGLRRTLRRFDGVACADDFLDSDEGLDKLDGIGMMVIAIGENLKKIDKETEGKLLERYPDVNWRGAKGARDILAHHYFDLDAEEVFDICQNDIPAGRFHWLTRPLPPMSFMLPPRSTRIYFCLTAIR